MNAEVEIMWKLLAISKYYTNCSFGGRRKTTEKKKQYVVRVLAEIQIGNLLNTNL
jgi:hypothetical protein